MKTIKTPDQILMEYVDCTTVNYNWPLIIEAIKAYHAQFELSDEEIDRYAMLNWDGNTEDFIDACRWYRDELKWRRNET
jgi:hypothetical protein